jgi:hypothetical protein
MPLPVIKAKEPLTPDLKKRLRTWINQCEYEVHIYGRICQSKPYFEVVEYLGDFVPVALVDGSDLEELNKPVAYKRRQFELQLSYIMQDVSRLKKWKAVEL